MRPNQRENYEPQDPRSASSGHDRLRADLKACVDSELAAPRGWYVRLHISLCTACQEEVKWLRRLGENMGDLEKAVPSPRLRARILAALPDNPPGMPALEPRKRLQWARLSPAPALGLVVGLACAAGLFAIIIRNSPKSGSPSGEKLAIITRHEHTFAPEKLNSPTSPDAKTVLVTDDPTSREADRRLATWLDAQTHREARQLDANHKQWAALVKSLRPRLASPAESGGLRLAMAVREVDDTENRLAAWAVHVGGVVSGRSGPAAHEPVNAAPLVGTNERYIPVAPSSTAGDRLMTLRVPAGRVLSLEQVLTQAGAFGGPGQVVAAGSKPVSAGSRRAQPPGHVRGVVPPSTYTLIGPPGAVSARKIGEPGDQSFARSRASGTITLQIELSSFVASDP